MSTYTQCQNEMHLINWSIIKTPSSENKGIHLWNGDVMASHGMVTLIPMFILTPPIIIQNSRRSVLNVACPDQHLFLHQKCFLHLLGYILLSL